MLALDYKLNGVNDMDVIFELLILIDLFMNASLTTQILASIFLLLFYLVLRELTKLLM